MTCYENGFMNTEMFSKLPNPHYNRQSRLPSSYTANEVKNFLIRLILETLVESVIMQSFF